MATEQSLQCISLEAAADLHLKQFNIVYVDSNGKAALTAATTTQPIGILQNTPVAGQPASIAIAGKSKIVMGSAQAIGAQVSSDSAGLGTVITVAAGGTVYNYAVGRLVTATVAANGIGECIIYPGGKALLV